MVLDWTTICHRVFSLYLWNVQGPCTKNIYRMFRCQKQKQRLPGAKRRHRRLHHEVRLFIASAHFLKVILKKTLIKCVVPLRLINAEKDVCDQNLSRLSNVFSKTQIISLLMMHSQQHQGRVPYSHRSHEDNKPTGLLCHWAQFLSLYHWVRVVTLLGVYSHYGYTCQSLY